MEDKKELRKTTEEESKQFEEFDRRCDRTLKTRGDQIKSVGGPSNIRMKETRYITISDVRPDDAAWFKEFCDKYTDRKQFLGMMVIRQVMERIDPLVGLINNEVTELSKKVDSLEKEIISLKATEPEKKGPVIPRTQGGAKHGG